MKAIVGLLALLGSLTVFAGGTSTSKGVAKGLAGIDTSPEHGQRLDQDLHNRLRAYRANPEDPNLWLQIARDYLDLATLDTWHYLDQAESFLKKVNQHAPKIPLVVMLLGRVEGARALDIKPSALTRLKWARKGFKYMDEAVRLAPSDQYLRLLRGEAQLLAHPVLRRGTTLLEDAATIEAGLEDFADNAYQSARAHLFLGSFYHKQKKSDEARKHWRRAVELAMDTKVAQEAQGRLKGPFSSVGYEGR